MKSYSIFFVMIFLTTINLFAFPFRVNQIPNGNKFGCANCHISPLGGGARNDFGKLVEQKYLDQGGNVIWNNSIASEDADGDGFTNGQELLDPNGSWKVGDSNPNNFNNVSNPGDRNSKPIGTDIHNLTIEYNFNLEQNYPNPFNPETTIRFTIPKESFVTLNIYDLLGKEIALLLNQFLSAGNYSILFNASKLSSGTYFYKIKTDNFTQIKKMILIK